MGLLTDVHLAADAGRINSTRQVQQRQSFAETMECDSVWLGPVKLEMRFENGLATDRRDSAGAAIRDRGCRIANICLTLREESRVIAATRVA
jgi:hypothetical protein